MTVSSGANHLLDPLQHAKLRCCRGGQHLRRPPLPAAFSHHVGERAADVRGDPDRTGCPGGRAGDDRPRGTRLWLRRTEMQQRRAEKAGGAAPVVHAARWRRSCVAWHRGAGCVRAPAAQAERRAPPRAASSSSCWRPGRDPRDATSTVSASRPAGPGARASGGAGACVQLQTGILKQGNIPCFT